MEKDMKKVQDRHDRAVETLLIVSFGAATLAFACGLWLGKLVWK